MEIKLGHIDLSNPSAPVLYIRYEDPRKTLKERKLALGPNFAPAYRQYLREYDPQEALYPCTPRNLEYVLADLAALAGIENGVSFEQLRWTCAVRDYRNGMPPDRLRQKLGLSLISWRESLPRSRSWRGRHCRRVEPGSRARYFRKVPGAFAPKNLSLLAPYDTLRPSGGRPMLGLAAARDIAIIILALSSIAVLVLLCVLIFQLVRLITMLRTEVMPILEATQETVGTVRGTAMFMGDHVVRPVVKASSYVSGVRSALRVLFTGAAANGRR